MTPDEMRDTAKIHASESGEDLRVALYRVGAALCERLDALVERLPERREQIARELLSSIIHAHVVRMMTPPSWPGEKAEYAASVADRLIAALDRERT